MKFTNFKISRESIFPIENVAHVRLRKTFYYISVTVHFRNSGFRSVSKPRKLVFIFTTGPTTSIFDIKDINFHKKSQLYPIKYALYIAYIPVSLITY